MLLMVSLQVFHSAQKSRVGVAARRLQKQQRRLAKAEESLSCPVFFLFLPFFFQQPELGNKMLMWPSVGRIE